MKRTLWLAAMLVLLTGCAASTVSNVPQAHPAPLAEAPLDVDLEDLKGELAAALHEIEARSTGEVKPAVVDAEAMTSMVIPDHSSIAGAVEYFSTTLHDKIQRSLIRSATFKAMVDEVLDEYRLPRALAYLPVIESAYVPTLTSSAGAHGLWQFMPATGMEYGLTIDWWMDERAHPEESTRAAAYYLRDLYAMFNDWPLALAAYNAGPGRIRRTLESTGATSFWELYENGSIPRETRGYVPTFYATVIIASDPATYGFELLESDKQDLRRVAVEGPVSLEYVAQVCGLPVDVLQNLNPHLRRSIVPPGTNSLRVPPAAVEAIAARATTMRYEDPHVQIATFTVRPGDSLKKLSRAVGVPSDQILKMNGLRGPNVAAGQTIFLPVSQTALSAKLEAARHATADRYHTVRKGDTLFSIARRHGLTVEELVDLNRLSGDQTIHPGDRLRVRLSGTVTGGM